MISTGTNDMSGINHACPGLRPGLTEPAFQAGNHNPGLRPDVLTMFLCFERWGRFTNFAMRFLVGFERDLVMGAAQDLVDRRVPAADVRARRALRRSLARRRFLPPIRPHRSQLLL